MLPVVPPYGCFTKVGARQEVNPVSGQGALVTSVHARDLCISANLGTLVTSESSSATNSIQQPSGRGLPRVPWRPPTFGNMLPPPEYGDLQARPLGRKPTVLCSALLPHGRMVSYSTPVALSPLEIIRQHEALQTKCSDTLSRHSNFPPQKTVPFEPKEGRYEKRSKAIKQIHTSR